MTTKRVSLKASSSSSTRPKPARGILSIDATGPLGRVISVRSHRRGTRGNVGGEGARAAPGRRRIDPVGAKQGADGLTRRSRPFLKDRWCCTRARATPNEGRRGARIAHRAPGGGGCLRRSCQAPAGFARRAARVRPRRQERVAAARRESENGAGQGCVCVSIGTRSARLAACPGVTAGDAC